MDASAEDVVAAAEPDFFFDIVSFNLDGFDFDQAFDEFCDAYAAIVAAGADKSQCGAAAAAPRGWLAGSGVDGGSKESTPESGVTDGDEPLLAGEESLSAYVSELERILLENDDDDEVAACPDGGEEGICVDDYFGDLLDPAAVEGVARNADEESLAAREDDEPTSRKRARHKIVRGTTVTTCSWEELEVTKRHLAPMQVPVPWVQATPALQCG